MSCFFCKGQMTADTTTHFADLGKCIIIVKNVPCYKCAQCGEVVYSAGVAKQLEKIVEALETTMTEIAVVSYAEKIA